MNSKKRIWIIDDDKETLALLQNGLQSEGFEVETFVNGTADLAKMDTSLPDVVILELDTPGVDGFELCAKMRSAHTVSTIVLSTRKEEMDRVLSLEMGADDYVTKPFGFRELVARIRALLRRMTYNQRQSADVMSIGDVTIDPNTRQVSRGDRQVLLSRREYALLNVLMRKAGKVITRNDLFATVWNENWIGNVRTLDVHIHWLREKLEENPSRPRYIQTVRGVGYRFAGADELSGAMRLS